MLISRRGPPRRPRTQHARASLGSAACLRPDGYGAACPDMAVTVCNGMSAPSGWISRPDRTRNGASPVMGDAADSLSGDAGPARRYAGTATRCLTATALVIRRRNVSCRFVVLPAAEHLLVDVRVLPVGDLDLDPDLGVHRHLPQPRSVRLGQGPVVPVRVDHPAGRRAGVPDRPRWQHARAGRAAGSGPGRGVPQLCPESRIGLTGEYRGPAGEAG